MYYSRCPIKGHGTLRIVEKANRKRKSKLLLFLSRSNKGRQLPYPKSLTLVFFQAPNKGTQKTPEATDTDRKKSKLEIVLNSKQPVQQPEEGAKRASYAEIKLSSPSTKEPPRSGGFRSEVS